jgi:N-acetylneuraminate lyase
MRLIVHVGHSAVEESRRLAAHARRIGVHAFATIGPTFFRAATLDQLIGYCGRIASAARQLPFYTERHK